MKNRLFDLLEQYIEKYNGKNIYYQKEQNEWKNYTCNQILESSLQLACSLNAMDIKLGNGTPEGMSKVGIVSQNCAQWLVVDLATQQSGAALVPIYPTITATESAYILNDAGVEILFVSDKNLYKKMQSIAHEVPTLKAIYTFDEVDGATNWSILLQPYTSESLKKINQIKANITTENLATIIYTSGTTGFPKGVMLSHKNIYSNIANSIACFSMCDVNGKALSFLPLNHIFEKMVIYLYMRKGISVYFAEDVAKVGENLREVKPDLFTTVPRLLEKVYEKIEEKGAELDGAKKKIFDWAMALAERYEINKNQGVWYNLQRKIADKLVYSKWRLAVGGNVKAIITGSAACQLRLQRIFSCANLVVMEGYGLTETSPVVTVNRYEESGRGFGTIGLPMPNQEVKLAADGEIICKGDHVMMGYYKNAQATAEVIIDGWFHTGDIATMVDNKFMKITDRKKELFKLSAGKYIAPQAIENKVKESAFIEQIMVVGSNEKFVGALIVPSIQNIKDYFSKQGKQLEDKIELINDADVMKLIRQELNSFNKNFSEHEHVKRFQLIPQEWTIDTGEMTPTLKLKRKVIAEKYKDLIAKIFNN
jgi:long-chain acyl-CoA synthetase